MAGRIVGEESPAKMAGRIFGENSGKKVEKFGAYRTIRSAKKLLHRSFNSMLEY